jgi:hypothetical protein
MFCQVNQKDIVESRDIGHILEEGVLVVRRKEMIYEVLRRNVDMTRSGEDFGFLTLGNFQIVVLKDVWNWQPMWIILPDCEMAEVNSKNLTAAVSAIDITHNEQGVIK